MKYDNSLHNSLLNEPIPCEDVVASPGLQGVLSETRALLVMIETELEATRKFIRFDQDGENVKDVEVKDMETDIYDQRNMANRILKKAVEIGQLLGR